jgi:hypothetical protein
MAKRDIKLDGGEVVTGADVTRLGVLAVHRALDKGFVLTHIPTGRCVLWSRLKKGATAARKELEPLDWTRPETHRARVERLQKEILDE